MKISISTWTLVGTWKNSKVKMTIIRILIGAFRTVTDELLMELEDLEKTGRVKTIQTTALLRTVRILRRATETRGDCCHSDSSEKSSVNADLKNSQGVKNTNRRVETIQTTALLRSVVILRRVLETWRE